MVPLDLSPFASVKLSMKAFALLLIHGNLGTALNMKKTVQNEKKLMQKEATQ